MALRLRPARRRREGLLRRQCAAHVRDVTLSVRPKGTLDDPARVEGDRDEPCFASAGWRQELRIEEAEARRGGKDNPSVLAAALTIDAPPL